MSEHPVDAVQAAGHVMSGAAILGALTGITTALATLFAILWYAIAIYETKTVQAWLKRFKQRRKK